MLHGQPYHPQTQGKDERFHRTLELELLRTRQYDDLPECQTQFDPWRDMYNQERPHEALGLQVPASRYQVSPVAFPESLPPIQYAPGDIVRQVHNRGEIKFQGQTYYLGESFYGLPVVVRPTTSDGVWDVYFCHQRLRQIDQRAGAS